MSTVAVKERPILFSGEMVRAILDGRKTQTRRVVKLENNTAGERVFLCKTAGRRVKSCIKLDERGPIWGPYAGSGDQPCPAEILHTFCPYGKPGDQLWVRETFSYYRPFAGDPTDKIIYKADRDNCGQYPVELDGQIVYVNDRMPWKPSIHMPRWASRIQLEVTNVRVERVRDISEDDAFAEGVPWNVVNDDIANGIYLDRPMRKEWCPQCKGEGTYQGLGQNHGVIEVDCPECDTGKKIFRNIWDSINAERGYGWNVNPWVWVVEFKRIDP